MGKIRNVILASLAMLAVVVLGLMLTTGSVRAASKNKNVQIGVSETHNGVLAKAAEQVEIDGVVNGDVLVATSKFVLKGTVNGSVYVVAESARIEGTVTGNVHVLASDVEIGARTNSVYAAASSFAASKDMVLSGGLAVAASKVIIEGTIAQSAWVAAASADYDAVTGGSVKFMASEINVGSNAQIGGDLTYDAGAQINIRNDQNIAGSIKQTAAPKKDTPVWAEKITGAIYGLLASLVLGFVILWLVPGSAIATGDYMKRYPAKSLISGAGFVFIAPVAILLTLVTLIGIPLGMVALMAYVTVLIVADVFVALWLGRQLLRRDKDKTAKGNVLPLLLGLVVIGLVKAVPILGGLVGFIMLLFGAGALVARSWERLTHTGKLQRVSS